MQRRLKSFLSLATKAGKIVTGEKGCEDSLRKGDAKLVIVCGDASNNTKKKFCNKSFFYKVPYYEFSTVEEINQTIGKMHKATIIIIDDGFACAIRELIEAEIDDRHEERQES